MPLTQPVAFEKGDTLYLVAPVVPHTPTQQEIEEYAFGKSVVEQLRQQAPNEHLAWFGGHYVQADKPNLNGAMWLTEDLAIASLTPLMMPVTVMHDPRSAVGVIAHADLQMPEGGRAKIETALALWKHRFPDAVSEAEHNYAQGTLMQSMECLAPNYECSVCRMPFMKLPKGAEKSNWCAHLKASDPSGGYTAAAGDETRNASRILRGVTFTGTGLIFGSRGATGADPAASLESFQEEVAEFHLKQHRDATSTSQPKKPLRSKRTMEIEDRDYQDLVAAKTERDALKTRIAEVEAEAAKVPDLDKRIEALEAEKVTEKARADAAETKVQAAEEQANRQRLRDERYEKLGTAFTEKIDSMPTTKANLLRDAESLEDTAWDQRLTEVEEAVAIKRDAQKDGEKEKKDESGTGLFAREEVARFQGGGSGGGTQERSHIQAPSERRSVVAGLSRRPVAKK